MACDTDVKFNSNISKPRIIICYKKMLKLDYALMNQFVFIQRIDVRFPGLSCYISIISLFKLIILHIISIIRLIPLSLLVLISWREDIRLDLSYFCLILHICWDYLSTRTSIEHIFTNPDTWKDKHRKHRVCTFQYIGPYYTRHVYIFLNYGYFI